MIGCHGPEALDLNNLENEVITFYDDANEEINFPSMNITTINNQEIVDLCDWIFLSVTPDVGEKIIKDLKDIFCEVPSK